VGDQEHARIIEIWISAISEDGGVERYDDLHLDVIDPKWKPRQTWMNGGLKAFHTAIEFRDNRHLPFVVGLGLSIAAEDNIGEHGTVSSSDLQARMDSTPPSLYLFPAGHDPIKELERAIRDGVVESDAVSRRMTFADDERVPCCYYLKFRRAGADDYTQSVFFLS
jgi:hypothetical protein